MMAEVEDAKEFEREANGEFQIIGEDNFTNGLGTSRQDQMIQNDNAKNVSSKPTPSKHHNVFIPIFQNVQQSQEQIEGNNNQANGFQDSQHQEAVPQFSTNPDVPPLPPPINPAQTGEKQKTLVTQYGRQLSGNSELELNFKKKNTLNQLSIKAKKQSYGGPIRGTESPPTIGGISVINNENTRGGLYHKNTTQQLYKPFNQKPGIFSQQKTINLNFFDDLQNCLDVESSNKNDYEDQRQFQDPDFSAIIKNPKASDLDIDERMIYESKEFGSNLNIETTSRDGRLNYANHNLDSSQIHSPIAHNDGSLEMRIKKQLRSTDKRHEQHQVKKLISEPPGQLNIEYLTEQLDQLSVKNSQSAGQRPLTTADFNTANRESEGDQFIPQLKLMNRKQENSMSKDDHLLKPRGKKEKRSHSRQLSLNSSFSDNVDKSNIKKFEGKQTLQTSKFRKDFNPNASYLVPVHNKNDESDIKNRVYMDPNEKLQLDDRRARMMVVNQMMGAQNAGLDNSFFMIVEKAPIEKIDDIEGRCAGLRRLICSIRINVSSTARFIIMSRVFEAISIFVILANSVSLAIEDPTQTDSPFYQQVLDNIFLCLYSMEMVLKILGLGFVFNKGAYLRDPWNILDFVIVMTGYLQIVLQGGSVNLSGLRSFRVLRPLRSIQRIEGLKVIVTALMNSVPLLRDTLIILLFFFFIFAIAGLQLFSGYLKRRCVHEETGVPHPDDDFCGVRDCPPGYFCGKRNANPNYDQTNFDTIFYSLIAIFTSVTLESWTYIMQYVQKSYTSVAFLFFIPLVFIGAFFLLNLTLAVIKSKFGQEHEKKSEASKTNKKRRKGQVLDFDNLDEVEKQKLIEGQSVARKEVLAKWRLILFIKQKMRRSVKKFKLKKMKKDLLIASNTKKEVVSKGLKNYATFLSSELNYLDTDDQKRERGQTFNDGQASERILLGQLGSTTSLQTQPQQITLGSLDDQQQAKSVVSTNQQKHANGGGFNFRELNQEPIAEEEDEYKTELSHNMGHGGFKNQNKISKGVRRESSGSNRILTSNSNQDNLERRRSSASRQPLSPTSPSKGIIFNIKECVEHADKKFEVFSSDNKKMNMIGMAELKNKRKQSIQLQNQRRKSVRKDKRRRKSIKIDHKFFRDFIKQDFDALENEYSEEQLMEIAQQLEEGDPMLDDDQGNLLFTILDEDFYDQLSDVSILSDENMVARATGNYHSQAMGNGTQNTHQSDNIDERNNTPYTQTTGKDVQPNGEATVNRQKSKTTQHQFASQELSISFDDDSDLQRNLHTNGDVAYENNQDLNLKTPGILRDGDQIKQSRSPRVEMKPLDKDALKKEGMQINKAQTIKISPRKSKSNYRKSQPQPVVTQKRAESQFQTTSSTVFTNLNHNATGYCDSNMPLNGQPTKGNQVKSSDNLIFDQKATFTSSKTRVQPIGPGSYYKSDEPSVIRHGPNTIFSQDYITMERSVLNSRYVISEHLQKHQKIYLRKDKFEFHSTQDIFEQREIIAKKIQLEKNKKIASAFTRNWKIKPYQRKQLIISKIFKPDEEQIEQLALLELDPSELEKLVQKKYDEPYISNLYVTGTLSICVHEVKDHQTNKTRKIQDMNLQSVFEDILFEESQSIMNIPQGGGLMSMSSQNFNSNIREKTYKKVKTLDVNQQFKVDISNILYLKNQSNPILSKSLKKSKAGQYFASQELRNKVTRKNEQQDLLKSESKKKELLLNKQAAKDAKLQRQLILTELTKDAFRSSQFRPLLTRRRNKLTDEERKKNYIMEIFNMYQEDKDEDDEDEEEEDSDEDAIKDDFIDWPINFKAEIMKAKKKAGDRKKSLYQWSGQDVLCDFDPQHASVACAQISDIRVWPMKLFGYWKKVQVLIKIFLRSSLFDNFLTICVAVNTVCLALDRKNIDPEEEAILGVLNTMFTWIFIAEMSLKIIGLGPLKYLKDKMNYLDGIVVILSIIEMIIVSGSKKGALSAFRAVRIFRIFRVLRVARLLRSLQSMQVIIGVLVKSMDSFIYLFLLLMLFLFIYSLLGMQVFGGLFFFDSNFSGPPGVPRTNFDNFNSAFFTAFQTMTMENWPYLLYDAMRSGVAKPISVLYFISWVFLGNFMLLNLFLAILLDSFTNDKVHKIEDDDEEKKQREKHLEELSKKEGAELIEYYSELNNMGDGNKKSTGLNKKKKKKKKKKDENLLDESFEFDKESISKKQSGGKEKKKVDFEFVECENSFYIFKKSNKIRLYFYRICTHSSFEWVILALIILSSIKLVIDTYMFDLPDDNIMKIISDNIDTFFTAAFATESCLKAISFGFIQDKGSYLRETWSQMDFFIVVTSIIDAAFSGIDLPIIKILRLLRTLRPLRFISHNSGMKTIVVALIQSVGGIFNVVIVILMVWMMFAILAVNLFGGKLMYCSVQPYLYHEKIECLKNRGEWKVQDFNFDSVPNAMITLFSLANGENWPDIMYNTINAQGVDIGPKINATPVNGYFFVVFILIGGFLFLNLFVGVIFKEFEDAQEEEKQAMMLKDREIQWVDMMKMIVNATPDLETTNVPKQKWRAAIHSFITGGNRSTNYFDLFIMCCIVLNMLQMAVSMEESSKLYNQILDYINYFFTSVFALECVLKLIAFGFSYYKTSWNVFDFCVVCASFFDIAMNQLNAASLKFLRVGPQLARVLRVMRVTRLFRLINKYKGLQALLQTIQFSLPSLFNVFSLLMLVYFIFAVLGTFLFRTITRGTVINPYINFSNFGMSLVILIRMSTGEDWNYVMFDTMRTAEDNCIPNETCGFWYAPLFFISYIMIATFVMLNLFILVIIQQFDMYYLDENNVINKFKEDLDKFKKAWTLKTKDHNCLKIKDTRLVSFFAEMDKDLGMRGDKNEVIIRNVMQMDLVSDNEGFVYFNELLFKSMRRVYGEKHVKNLILVQHELTAMRKIEDIKEKMIKKSRMQERIKAVQVNPFMLKMYMNTSFAGWLKIMRQNLDKREKEIINGQDKYEMDSNRSTNGNANKIQDSNWEYKTDEDVEVSDTEYEDNLDQYDPDAEDEQDAQYDEEDSSYIEDQDYEDEDIDSSRMLNNNDENRKDGRKMVNVSDIQSRQGSFEQQPEQLPQKSPQRQQQQQTKDGRYNQQKEDSQEFVQNNSPDRTQEKKSFKGTRKTVSQKSSPKSKKIKTENIEKFEPILVDQSDRKQSQRKKKDNVLISSRSGGSRQDDYDENPDNQDNLGGDGAGKQGNENDLVLLKINLQK